MIQSIRNCLIPDHLEYQVSHICTFIDCGQITRWCCQECFSKGVHNHNKSDNSHIMNRTEILSRVMNQCEKNKKDLNLYKSRQANLFKQIINECLKMEKSLMDYSYQNQIIEKQLQKFITNFEQCLSNLDENHFQQLDNDKINQIIRIDQYQFDEHHVKQQLQQPLDNIRQQLNQIESIIKVYQENLKQINQSSNKIIDNKTNYIVQEIDQTNSYYNASSISKNEQYLAYGAKDEKLFKIYDIKLKKIIKEIQLDNCLSVCQFTQDSQQLYVGFSDGCVSGYDIQKGFKEIYKQKIHQDQIILNLITIQDKYLITCSGDHTIIKTDIKSKKQIFQLYCHTLAIDYNEKDDILVSGPNDQSIKLWNCMNKSILINKKSILINKVQSHYNQIRQIQLVNNNLNILSLDLDGNLYKWRIDLINKDLIQLQQFSDQNKIFNFYYGNQYQNLLLICNNYAKIINIQGETLNTIEHGGQDNYYNFDCRQLDNLKYIQIRARNKIMLAISQV